ncbi:MAG: 4-hydroxy-2-oxovalerate aldolase [Acidimicrobiia bacterium]|nr:4-hydroxy-2-oxovalerate aldolase [Acidimicrobiia bacterium]
MTAAFRLTDSTLRDGSHAIRHQFTVDQVRAVVRGLDRAGVEVIEVAHGDGLGGSSFNYGFSRIDEMDLIRAAVDEADNARIAVLLLPGIGTKDDLVHAANIGASVARIATHSTEADISHQHMALAKDLGMETVGFLMLSHMVASGDLLDQAKRMESYGADAVYVVDSAGAMTIRDTMERISMLKHGLDCGVGLHAHNNLSLAVANSLAAIGEGIDQVDGCLIGLGAGAGNCPTEILVAACDKAGYETGIDLTELLDVATDVVRPLSPNQGVIDRDGLMLGYAGVYGSFLLHAKRAAEVYGVACDDILLELGRRGIVGGQEDMIIDVALELRQAADSSDAPR